MHPSAFTLSLILFVLCISVGAVLNFVRRDKRTASDETQVRLVGGDTATLWHFSSQAKDLIATLESTWHHWNNAGEVLVHPLDINLAKQPEHDKARQLLDQAREFQVLYGSHIGYVKARIPEFKSIAMRMRCSMNHAVF